MTELTTANPITNSSSSTTLAQRLAEGKIPVTEALRYAMILAEALRKLHDEGRVHGAIAPGNLALTATGLDLQGARLTSDHTSYSAPEVLDGKPADGRSDIFSFGSVLYEMLTGRAPYQGKDRSVPMPTGSPAVDRLVASCIALDPAARCQRMQKVMLELKLLSVAAARVGAPPAARRETGVVADAIRAEMGLIEARINARLQAQEKKSAELMKVASEALNRPEENSDISASMLQMESRVAARLQAVDKKVAEIQRTTSEALYREPVQAGLDAAELQQVEDRITARLQSHEQAMAEMHRVAGEAVATLRDQLSTVGSELATAQERAAQAELSIEASGERVVQRVQQSIDAVSDRLALLEAKFASLETQPAPAVDETRVESIEKSLDALRRQTSELHDLVAEDMLSFEHSLKTQATAIDSARTAMAQTDDLVERVVEALESLQSTVLDHSEERALAVN